MTNMTKTWIRSIFKHRVEPSFVIDFAELFTFCFSALRKCPAMKTWNGSRIFCSKVNYIIWKIDCCSAIVFWPLKWLMAFFCCTSKTQLNFWKNNFNPISLKGKKQLTKICANCANIIILMSKNLITVIFTFNESRNSYNSC